MKNFIALQTSETQAMYKLYETLLEKDSSPEEITDSFYHKLKGDYNFTDMAAQKTATSLLAQFSSPTYTSQFIESSTHSPSDDIVISALDAELFYQKTLDDPLITPEIKSLLFSFIVYYRQNEHPSGWIKYDKKTIFYLAGLNKISISKQEDLTKYLHSHYNLNMQVIGSNQPIPCFNIDWLTDQSPLGSPDNPSINIGPLSPTTIQNYILKGE